MIRINTASRIDSITDRFSDCSVGAPTYRCDATVVLRRFEMNCLDTGILDVAAYSLSRVHGKGDCKSNGFQEYHYRR